MCIRDRLGDGTTTSRTSPVQIGTGRPWSAISAGASHSCGLSEGTAWCWGYNGNGRLGDGTTADRTSPAQVGAETTWKLLDAGRTHTVGGR